MIQDAVSNSVAPQSITRVVYYKITLYLLLMIVNVANIMTSSSLSVYILYIELIAINHTFFHLLCFVKCRMLLIDATLLIPEVNFYLNCFNWTAVNWVQYLWVVCKRSCTTPPVCDLFLLRPCIKCASSLKAHSFLMYFYLFFLGNINAMTYFRCIQKYKTYIFIFNCMIKIIARDNLVVAGYW